MKVVLTPERIREPRTKKSWTPATTLHSQSAPVELIPGSHLLPRASTGSPSQKSHPFFRPQKVLKESQDSNKRIRLSLWTRIGAAFGLDNCGSFPFVGLQFVRGGFVCTATCQRAICPEEGKRLK